MSPENPSILLAVAAGLLSFASPCVLPLVPAYLGQLTAVAVAEAARRGDGAPSRWAAFRHALAYVAGFSAVFTLLGVTATFAAAGLSPWVPQIRQVGGVVLVILGLSLAGIVRIPVLERTWRPLDAGASASVAQATGTFALQPAGGPGFADRMGGRMVSSRGGLLASFGMGAIFAVGWTPCVGVTFSAILGLASTAGTVAQGGVLLIAYTLGLGLPFLAIALVYDRAPGLLRPLIRHGRAVSIAGGLLVAAIGLALIFDWLNLIVSLFPFTNPL